jgi:hypothetical protein
MPQHQGAYQPPRILLIIGGPSARLAGLVEQHLLAGTPIIDIAAGDTLEARAASATLSGGDQLAIKLLLTVSRPEAVPAPGALARVGDTLLAPPRSAGWDAVLALWSLPGSEARTGGPARCAHRVAVGKWQLTDSAWRVSDTSAGEISVRLHAIANRIALTPSTRS